MDRSVLATQLEWLVPLTAPLDEMLLYRTAGTTGHALRVPHHRRSVAALLPLIEVALRAWGITLDVRPGEVACALLGAQADTATYATVLAGWGGAGFTKLNLHPKQWPSPESAARFLAAFNPRLLTGDPITFAELLRQQPRITPQAMLTTAVAMSDELRTLLSEQFNCPVIDWYSLTETGPIGFRCPHAGKGEPEAFHIVAADLHIELLDPDGAAVPEGARGEVVVSGGRNPFVPLLRYRTGDWGRLVRAPCSCGDSSLRIADLEGRAPVLFAKDDGSVVNPVDLARVLRGFALVCHELTQHADRRLSLVIRTMPDHPIDEDALRSRLADHLGALPLDITYDPALGNRSGKSYPWRSAVDLNAILDVASQQPHAIPAAKLNARTLPPKLHNAPVQHLDHPGAHRPHRLYVALTTHCNRACPRCSTSSSPQKKTFLSQTAFEALLPDGRDFEVQLEGGEPLVHPEFGQFMATVRAHPRYERVVLCTNGVSMPRQPERLRAFIDRLGKPLTIKLSWNHYLRDHDPDLLKLAQRLQSLTDDNAEVSFVLNVRLRPGQDEDIRQAVADAGLAASANVFFLEGYGLASGTPGWELPHAVWGDFTLANPDGSTHGTDLLARSAAMAELP